jgi:hypothetical protein
VLSSQDSEADEDVEKIGSLIWNCYNLAAHDDDLKISHGIMNDAAIVHGPLCALRGSGTTAHLHLARGAATQRGHLMFTEALQQG